MALTHVVHFRGKIADPSAHCRSGWEELGCAGIRAPDVPTCSCGALLCDTCSMLGSKQLELDSTERKTRTGRCLLQGGSALSALWTLLRCMSSAKATATHLNPGSSWQLGEVSGSWPAIVKLQEHVYDLSQNHLLSSPLC